MNGAGDNNSCVRGVYVEVHNRGVVQAASVQVMLLVTTPSVALAPLPSGYQANVLAGTAISNPSWQTVGIRTVSNLRAGFPQVAEFALPSTMLPPPASLPVSQHHCTVALLHSTQDPFSSTETNVDLLTLADRKVAQRNLEIFAFVGTPPPPGVGPWAQVDLHGVPGEWDALKELIIDLRQFHGRLGLLLPPNLEVREPGKLRPLDEKIGARWVEEQSERLGSYLKRGRFNHRLCERMLGDIKRLARQPLLGTPAEARFAVLSGLQLRAGARYPLFLYFEVHGMKAGATQAVNVVQRDLKTRRIEGGATWHLVLHPQGKR